MVNLLSNNFDKEVRNILIKILKIDKKEKYLILDTETVENWDSIAHLMIIEELSNNYKINIPTQDALNLLSEIEIIEYLNKNHVRGGQRHHNSADSSVCGRLDFLALALWKFIRAYLFPRVEVALEKAILGSCSKSFPRKFEIRHPRGKKRV